MKLSAQLAAITLAVASVAASAQAAPKVDSAWARPTVAGQSVGGAFLTIRSGTADRLVSATTPAADAVELHSMAMDGSTMRMRQVPAIDIAAGQPVELKPGGLHMMLIGLKKPLEAGQTIPLTLQFEKAGKVDVSVPVSQRAPGGAADHSGHKH